MEYQLGIIKSIIESYFDDLKNPAFDVFRDDLTFGKMLRSKLILSIAKDSNLSVKICAIIELIHFASLLHDDVIDDSKLRRGKISINAKYGDKTAIMLGDILYSKAFYEIACLDLALSKIISNSVLNLSLGELEDVSLSNSFNDDEKKYIQMIEHKTASLIQASAECAGFLIGDRSDKFKVYGNSLGIAFQIIDDLLDITQNEAKLGKTPFSDFKEGKTTIPYIFLYQKMQEDEQMQLLSYFKKKLNKEEQNWVNNKIEKYGIIEQTKQIANDYGNKALSVLSKDDLVLVAIIKDILQRDF